ncbi:MAG TPA: DNA gyrase subunit A [Saprospirales bacterium]|nr:DNA gyrase subunit A [Saprospirales bacterium]
MNENPRVIPISIEEQMKNAYIDYSMSVIVGRALPDVRDGLKPVHRRVLYGMHDLGVSYNKAYKKSARIVGEVLGKYHPHGDSSVYDTMVRMAQDWSLRYPLVDGQGNFGSMDGDSPAAMRYTEARLARISDELLSDIRKDTVDFKLNFDDSLEEPTVLPAKFPNLLVNGTSGIAVGMATNMLPHNLSEVIDGVIAMVHNPEITVDELMEHVKAPDFPTGGVIYGYEGVKESFRTGRGKIVLRGKAKIESKGDRETIIISEIPYQLNKASLVAKIASLVHEDKISGISDIRDESDRTGLRIVVEVKRDAIAKVILSQLFKYTPLQSSYSVNNVVLVNGRPELLNLSQLLHEFIKFRIEVIIRRTQYELKKAEERAHILEGLLIALDHIDEVIRTIRESKTVEEASQSLQQRFDLSEIQAKAILDMRLQKLVSLEINKLKEEYEELMKHIADLKEILASPERQNQIVIDEMEEIREKYGDKRRTNIEMAEGDINIEDIIPDHKMVVTISHLGYIKRTLASEYRTQGRGGRGSTGSKTRDEDFIEHVFVATNHNYLLLFTEQGKCYWLRVYEIPEGSKTGTGRVIQNMINIPQDDKIKAYIPLTNLSDKEFLNSHYIFLCTQNGIVKKTSLEAFSRPRANGINAITIQEGDTLLEAKLTNGNYEIILANSSGYAIRFDEQKVRPMGRNAAGVKGMRLKNGDYVVGMVRIVRDDTEKSIFVVSELGNGKRSDLEDYRETNRGGKGVKTLKISPKTGKLVAIKTVSDEDHVIITTKHGVMIRMDMEHLRVMGRATQGVRVIRLDEGDAISDLAVIRKAGLESKSNEEE